MTAANTAQHTGHLAGHRVSRIGYGAMQLAGLRGQPAPDHDTSIAVLRKAIELGVNHIDTADFYGDHVANSLIREALSPYPDDLVLVSKVGAAHTAEGLVAAQRPEELRAGVEANLAHLGVEQVDVVNLRRMDGGSGVVATGEQIVDLDSQLAEMVALRDEGKVGAIGVSTVSLDQLQAALPVGIACVQNAYSVLQRSDEPLLSLCAEHDIAWVPYFPLGSAFPGFAKVTDEPAVRTAATKLGVTPAQVGLAWLLAHDPRVLLIAGTSSIEHLADNLAAGQVRLDTATMATLDSLSAG